MSNLQGALGKVSGRSYKAAPRQLLQVEHDHISKEDAATAKQAAQLGREALGGQQGSGVVKRDPLTRRETLILLEAIYERVLKIENIKRIAPENPEMEAALYVLVNFLSGYILTLIGLLGLASLLPKPMHFGGPCTS